MKNGMRVILLIKYYFYSVHKYLLISLCFLLSLLFATVAYHRFEISGDYLYRAVFSFGIPLLLIALLAAGMAYSLRIKNGNKMILFQKPFRNLQLLLSSSYTLLVLWAILSFSKSGENDKENITFMKIPVFSDSSSHRNMMAYQCLKDILWQVRHNPDDTNIYISAIWADPTDTIVHGQKMKENIYIEYNIPDMGKHVFHFTYCCNDNQGYPINKRGKP